MQRIDHDRLGAIGIELCRYASDLEKYLKGWKRPDEYERVEGWSDPIQGTYFNRHQELWWKYAVPIGKLLIDALKSGAFVNEDERFRQRLLSRFGAVKQLHPEWFAAAKTFVYGAEYSWRRSTKSVRKFEHETYLWANAFPAFLRYLIAVVGCD